MNLFAFAGDDNHTTYDLGVATNNGPKATVLTNSSSVTFEDVFPAKFSFQAVHETVTHFVSCKAKQL